MFKECTSKEVVSSPLPPLPRLLYKGSKLKTLWKVGRGGGGNYKYEGEGCCMGPLLISQV